MLTLGRQNALRERLRATQPGWQPATEQFADTVRQHLTPTARVLDLGCGRGGLVEQLAHPHAQIIGIDPDHDSLREHRLDIARVNGLSPLPFAAASFDLIYASWVLEHWAHPQRELSEIGRILKPGGAFVFITPNAQHPLLWANYALARTQLQDRLVETLYGRAEADTFAIHYRANTPTALYNLAKKAGLMLHTLHLISDPTYLAFTPSLFRLATAVEQYLPNIHLVGLLKRTENNDTLLG